jgi:bacillithiol system protein YtxJ
MEWIAIDSASQVKDIKEQRGLSLLFKHSTRCSISAMVKRRFEKDWEQLPSDLPLYYLDLIAFREISNEVANIFFVHHESPQLLLIENGECILDLSHGDVTVEEVLSVLTG